MSVDTLAVLLEAAKEDKWVRWLADAVWAAARVKVVVRVVFWCLQNDSKIEAAGNKGRRWEYVRMGCEDAPYLDKRH